MPVFALDDNLIFPHPVLHEPDGLLAVGGDLSVSRLLLAYRWGIFPWYHEDQPLLWWWTSPRLVMKPENVKISHSVKSLMNKKKFTVSLNQQFREVMKRCGETPRKGQDGTWIMPEMIEAYSALFNLGYAQSVEVYEDNKLVGGLYGIVLGRIFFGESMFSEVDNASKIGFIHFAKHLHEKGFALIDCQQDTAHMRTLGADLISEKIFLEALKDNHLFMLQKKT